MYFIEFQDREFEFKYNLKNSEITQNKLLLKNELCDHVRKKGFKKLYLPR